MKILVVTPHFFPENFKVNDLAFELAKRGHDVTVMTAIPDYPQGHFYNGYGIFKKRTETIRNVKVIRSLIIPRHDGSAKWLALNYISYTIFALLRSLILAFTKKFDAIFVHETSPVMVGIPAIILKKIQKIPVYFWVLDLWPESLKAAGGINNKHILATFRNLSKWIYKNCTKILISSKGFESSIIKIGDFKSKIEYFPNWNDIESHKPDANYQIIDYPEGMNVLFAGNIGEAQDMQNLVKCAILLQNEPINFILVGDGRKKKYVEDCIKQYNLTNIKMLGRHPIEMMPEFFSKADLLFLSLKDEEIFSLTVPAKLQAYMSSGKPIVAMINGEGADLIREADCGWTVPAGKANELAALLKKLFEVDKQILKDKGENGKKYCHEHFEFQRSIDNLEKIMSS